MKRAALLMGWFSAPVLLVFIATIAIPETAAQDKPGIVFLAPDQDQLIEGHKYEINWIATGVDSVSISISGIKTSLPDLQRRFRLPIAEKVSPDAGSLSWTVPYLDTVMVLITVTGNGPNGRILAEESRLFFFRPAVLRDRHQDGIYVDLHDEHRQRLYVMENDRLKKAYLTSGAPRNHILPLDVHPAEDHDHAGVFSVMNKYDVWHSRLFDRIMPWAMRYWNGHFIHATSDDYYPMLGKAASHGCNRLAIEQAEELYKATSVGTRVEIIVK